MDVYTKNMKDYYTLQREEERNNILASRTRERLSTSRICPCGIKGCNCKGKSSCNCTLRFRVTKQAKKNNARTNRNNKKQVLETIKNYDGNNITPKELRKLMVKFGYKIAYRTGYLKSLYWCKLRNTIKESCNYICQICITQIPLDIHHITYIRLGEELPEDLIAVCRECHNRLEVEKKMKERKVKPSKKIVKSKEPSQIITNDFRQRILNGEYFSRIF